MSELDTLLKRTEEVALRGGKKLTVREITVEDAIKISEVIIEMFSEFDPTVFKGVSPYVAIVKTLSNPAFMASMKKVLAVVTDSNKETFDNMPLLDLLKLVKSFLKINPLSEIQSLFFEVRDMFSQKDGVAKEKTT